MKPIESYFILLKDQHGKEVGMGFDVPGYATDMSKARFPILPAHQKAYVEGFTDAYQFIMMAEQQKRKSVGENQARGKVEPSPKENPLIITE